MVRKQVLGQCVRDAGGWTERPNLGTLNEVTSATLLLQGSQNHHNPAALLRQRKFYLKIKLCFVFFVLTQVNEIPKKLLVGSIQGWKQLINNISITSKH